MCCLGWPQIDCPSSKWGGLRIVPVHPSVCPMWFLTNRPWSFLHILHQYQVWSGNDARLFKMLILSVRTYFNRCTIFLSFSIAEFAVICLFADKYVIELTWSMLQLLSPIGWLVQLIKCIGHRKLSQYLLLPNCYYRRLHLYLKLLLWYFVILVSVEIGPNWQVDGHFVYKY